MDSTGQENLSGAFPVWADLWIAPFTNTLLTNERRRKQERTSRPLWFQGFLCLVLRKGYRRRIYGSQEIAAL